MNNLSWVEIVVSILSGLAVCIPLVVKLVQTVKAAVQEKNWSQIVAIVLDLMQQAEGLFAEGAARKAWVMAGERETRHGNRAAKQKGSLR